MNKEIVTVPKESISTMTFSMANLKAPNLKELLFNKIVQAKKLGNTYKSKVVIMFQTPEGPKQTETTIWSACSDFIQLKGGVTIPVRSIIDVKL